MWIKILFIKLTNSSKHSLMLAKSCIEVHLMHEFMHPKPFSCFVATNMPNPLFQSKTHVLVGSMPFHSHTWHVAKTGIEAHLIHEFMPLEPFLVFLQQTCPIHYYRSKTQVFDGFAPFCCRTQPAAKTSIGVHLKNKFVPRKPFLVWSQRTCSIHNLGLKLMCTILFDTSMHFYVDFDDS